MQGNSKSIEAGRRPSSAVRAPSSRERGEGEDIAIDDIAIVGGGIIGICIAAFLAEAGRGVTVFDRTGICEETSSGNASAFAFSDVLPLAHKGMIRQLPKWLADPLGPLSIPPAYLPKLLPWLIRFWRAGRSDRYEAGLAAQAGMMRLAADAARERLAGVLRKRGRVQGVAAGLGGEAAVRHRLPACRGRGTGGLAAGAFAAIRKGHVRAGMEDCRRSQSAREPAPTAPRSNPLEHHRSCAAAADLCEAPCVAPPVC